jgi:hypothetical protein
MHKPRRSSIASAARPAQGTRRGFIALATSVLLSACASGPRTAPATAQSAPDQFSTRKPDEIAPPSARKLGEFRVVPVAAKASSDSTPAAQPGADSARR